jgi:hypothetical protein
MNSFKSERRKQHTSSAALNPPSTFGATRGHTPSMSQEQDMSGLHAGHSLADFTVHHTGDSATAPPVQKVDATHSQGQPDRPEQAPSQEHRENRTGLPDSLKAGVEQLSGYSLDDIRVHYNSPRPAEVQALAYTQGTEIHVGPGQEQHLAHEAWHVVQQKQGRVQPTMQMKGVAINDDEGLEREADVMGSKAMSEQAEGFQRLLIEDSSKPQVTIDGQPLRQLQARGSVIQRVQSALTLEEDDDGDTIIKTVRWLSKSRPGTSKSKQGDHVFPFEAILDTFENRLRGLTLEDAAKDLINYAEGLTEMPGYERAQSWYKNQLTAWISNANSATNIDGELIATWIDQLVGYRNMLPLSVTTYRNSSGGHGESQKVGNLAYWDQLYADGKLERKDCAADPVETAWETCDYHPTDSVPDQEIGDTLAQFILSMEWAFPHLFADEDAMCEEGELREKLDNVIEGLLDRFKKTDVDTRKKTILKYVDDRL